MAGDPLYEPLGGPAAPRRTGRGRVVRLLVALAVAGGAAAAGVWSLRGKGSEQAVAVAPIEMAPKVQPPQAVAAAAPATPAASVAPPLEAPSSGGTSVEIQNGVKIVRFNPASSSASIAIPVETPGASALKPAPDPRVSEMSRWGTLPRRGSDGLRPADVYARPAAPVTGSQIALLVAGMGSDQLTTADAARRLPPAVDFAFPSDIADPAAQVAETRRAGHEVLLQLAVSPAAVPSVGAQDGALEALHRRLARFAGYAGVLIDAAAADEPQRRDMVTRGLLVVDAPSASAASVPGIAADLSIDGAAGRAAVRDALDRLVAIARANGTAVGLIAHPALATDDLAALTNSLAGQGVTLVPLTALAKRRPAVANAAKE